MQISRHLAKYTVALAAAASLGMLACADSPTAFPTGSLGQLPVSLSVSSLRAAPGSRVSVAVSLGGTDAAGIQGSLRFDPSRLRFIGQSAQGRAISLVNDELASAGELRFTAFHPEGVSGRVALFVFEARTASYAEGLRYEHQAASTADLKALQVVSPPLGEDGSLPVPAEARVLSLADWGARVDIAGRSAPVALRPGEYRLNLAYGDIDFDGTIGLFDYLGVANAAVGNDELIIGTDGPAVDVDLVVAGNVFPENAGGSCGRETNGGRILDLFDYLAIANEAVGVNEACVGQVIPGRGPLPSATRTLSGAGLIVNNGDTLRMRGDSVYVLDGTLTVRDGGVLQIAAGTQVLGLTGSTQTTAIFIERGGRIYAEGTLNQPILFSCTGTNKFKGCWGGIFIAGRGTVNIGGTIPGGSTPLGPSPDGCNQRQGEGNAPLYGGCDPNDNSGVIRYAIIEYGGRVVTQDSELNGLTLGGVGRGTTLEYIQIHAGTDDGIEMFGGEVNVRYLVLTGNDDDGFDVSFGYTGSAQFVIVQNDAGSATGDSKGIEADGNEPQPGQILAVRTAPQLYNFTMVGNLSQSLSSNNAIHLRRAVGLTLANSLVAGYATGLDIDDPLTCDSWGTGAIRIINTTFIDVANLGNDDGSDPACVAGASTTEGEQAFITAEATNRVRTGLASVLRDATNTSLPDWRMLLASGAPAEGGTAAAPAGNTFLVATSYRGAVAPATTAGDIPWYSGWTRPFQTATTP